MEQALRDFTTTGFLDLGSGFVLAVDPSHRHPHQHIPFEDSWLVVDTLATAAADVVFGPESFCGPGPLQGRKLAKLLPLLTNQYGRQVYHPEQTNNGDLTLSTVIVFPVAGAPLEQIRLPVTSLADTISWLQDRLPLRDVQLELVGEMERARHQMSLLPPPPTNSNVRRPATVQERLEEYLTGGAEEDIIRRAAYHLDDFSAIVEGMLTYTMTATDAARSSYGYDGSFLLAVQRWATAKARSLSAPAGVVRVSTLDLSINTPGHPYVPMIATDRYFELRALRQKYRGKLPHFVLRNGLVDLPGGGEDDPRGRKSKLNMTERVSAWKALQAGDTLTRLSHQYDVGLATIERAVAEIEPYAPILCGTPALNQWGFAEPEADHDPHSMLDTRERRLVWALKLAHAVRLSPPAPGNEPLADLAAGRLDRFHGGHAEIEQLVMRAVLDGLLPAEIVAPVLRQSPEDGTNFFDVREDWALSFVDMLKHTLARPGMGAAA